MAKKVPEPQQPTYAAAMAELDGILEAIENGDADIDVLSEHVARAAELLKTCRAKLTGTELRVRKIVEELAAAEPEQGEE
jgi:exodeoxyribonuclease VII small subunit